MEGDRSNHEVIECYGRYRALASGKVPEITFSCNRWKTSSPDSYYLVNHQIIDLFLNLYIILFTCQYDIKSLKLE
jgi:hypothetical protein